jgi:hypothetical protein
MPPPDRIYRRSVVPFGALLIVGGAVMLALSLHPGVRITSPFPFVERDSANRAKIAGLSVVHLIFGIGLLKRSRILWIACMVYVGLATAFVDLGLWFDPPFSLHGAGERMLFALFNTLVNGLVIWFLYSAKPVFTSVKN